MQFMKRPPLDHYVWGLNEFIKFYKLKDYDALGGMQTKILPNRYTHLCDYVKLGLWWKKNP